MSTKEFRLYGPPGTGKTTTVSKNITRALAKYYPEDVYAVSFTKAAAVELAGAQSALPRENIGTIHSLCYRWMGSPKIAEVEADLIKDWNERHPKWPIRKSAADGSETKSQLLSAYNRRRSIGIDRPDDFERASLKDKLSQMRNFINAWEDFKYETGSIDFGDMLIHAPQSIGAKVLFVDEAQDNSPRQWDVVRSWGESAEVFIVSGDDDQAIYEAITGADVKKFLTPIPEENVRVLSQSYRLPRQIHDYSQRWIKKLGGRRQQKEFNPMDREGKVQQLGTSLKDASDLHDRIREHVNRGQSVMVLASCAYMLEEIIGYFRTKGVPFHNPYRKTDGRWNPLRKTARRVEAFLHCSEMVRRASEGMPSRSIHIDVWALWLDMIKSSGNLVHGAKASIVDCNTDWDPLSPLEVVDSERMLNAVIGGDLGWLKDNVTSKYKKSIDYPLSIARNGGASALRDEPKVIVGTIHSTKGGESDVVYLAPKISEASFKSLKSGQGARDALTRLFYVGITRAREELYLLRSNKGRYVTWV